MTTLIKNGTIITATDIYKADQQQRRVLHQARLHDEPGGCTRANVPGPAAVERVDDALVVVIPVGRRRALRAGVRPDADARARAASRAGLVEEAPSNPHLRSRRLARVDREDRGTAFSRQAEEPPGIPRERDRLWKVRSISQRHQHDALAVVGLVDGRQHEIMVRYPERLRLVVLDGKDDALGAVQVVSVAVDNRLSSPEHLRAEHDRILNALQELDFHHALGKIPEEEYPFQRAALLQQGAGVLRQLDEFEPQAPTLDAETRLEAAIAARRADAAQVGGGSTTGRDGGATQAEAILEDSVAQATSLDDDIEAQLAARRRTRQDRSAGFCPQCGRPIQKSDRFCPRCGKDLS